MPFDAKPSSAASDITYQHQAGDAVTVDGVDYTLKAPAAAWEMADVDGNIVYITEDHLAGEGDPNAPEESDEEAGAPVDMSKMDLKSMAPDKKGLLKAKLKKEAGF